MYNRRRFSHIAIFIVLAIFLTGCGLFKTPVPTEPVEFTVSYPLDGVPHAAQESLGGRSSQSVVKALRLTRGPGLEPENLHNGFSAKGWNRANPSIDVAVEEGLYFQFGFTVDKGFKVSLSEFDVWLRRSALNAPMNYELRVSFDGFAEHAETVASFNYYGRTSGTAPAEDPLKENPYYYMEKDLPGRPNEHTSVGDPIRTVDLTTLDFLQDIPGGTTVTFRLYAWGNDSTASTNTVALGRMHGPQIKGIVAPE